MISRIFPLILFAGLLMQAGILPASPVSKAGADTAYAGSLYRRARSLESEARYDSSASIYDLASREYLRKKDYVKYLVCRNSIITVKRRAGITEGLLGEARSNLGFALKRLKYSAPVTGDCYSILGNIWSDDRDLDSAMYYFSTALGIWSEYAPSESARIANAYRNIGTVYSSTGAMDSARLNIMRSILIRQAHYPERLADLAPDYNILGVIAYYEGGWDTCEYYFSKVAEIREKTSGPKHPVTAEAYNNLAALYMERARYDTALALNRKAYHIREESLSPNHPDLALSLNNIGNIYIAMGNYEAALENHSKALAIRKILYPDNEHPDLAMSYANLGVICLDMGLYKQALGYFLTSLDIQVKVFGPDSPNTANAYNSVGAAYDNLGEYDKSFTYLNKALAIRQEKGYTGGVATSLGNIGSTYKNKGDYDLALAYYRKSLKMLRSIAGKDQLPAITGKYRNIGDIYLKKGQADTALSWFCRALETDIQIFGDDSPELIGDYLNRGAALGELKRFGEEMDDYRKGYKLVLKTFGKVHPEAGNFLSDMARNFLDTGSADSAIYYIREALAVKEAIYPFRHPEIAGLYREKGEVFERAGRSDSARVAYMRSLEAGYSSMLRTDSINLSLILHEPEFASTLLDLCRLNYSDFLVTGDLRYLKDNIGLFGQVESVSRKVMSGFLLEETRIALLNMISKYSIYAIDAAYQLYHRTGEIFYFQKALEFSELNKASVLQNLVNQYAERSDSLSAGSLLVSRNNLLGFINYLEMKLHDGHFSDNYPGKKVRSDYDSCLISLSIINDSINRHLDNKGALYSVDGAGLLALIAGRLEPGSALISYSAYDSVLYTFVTGKNGYALRKQIIRPAGLLSKLIGQYLGELKKYGKEEVVRTGNELYRYLLGNIQDNIRGMDKLVIIPDKDLLNLPFETLCRSKSAVRVFSDFRSLPYLIRDHEIIYHYSIRLWSMELRRSEEAARGLLAFAPVFASSGANEAVPLSEQGRESINTLPFSLAEADSIKSICTTFGIGADTVTSGNATESNLVRCIGDYRYVHLATHQVSDRGTSAYAGLVFSDYRKQGAGSDSLKTSDGILYSGELYPLRLKADLVTLSACETGTGKIEEGEGVIGLVRGFLYAGAGNIIYSYWKVGDRTAMLFMKTFYRHVFSGDTYAAALRKTKLELINDPGTAYPLIWGAFSLIGRQGG